MECHDARILLQFARPGEPLDAGERAALQQHIDACPDCAARAQADRHVDETLARLMKEVSVPGDLKNKVLARLAADRPRRVWPWAAAVAAALLIGMSGAGLWALKQPTRVTMDDVIAFDAMGRSQKDDEIAAEFQQRGITMRVPGEFDTRYLRRAEVVDFKGRRVARLAYQTIDAQGWPVIADIVVLGPEQFGIDDSLLGERGPNINILRPGGYIYLVYHNGSYRALLRGEN